MIRNLILVLGDQLSPALSSLADGDPRRDIVLMLEVAAETAYVPHHKKKIAFILAAMRHFRDELAGLGWTVDYVRLDDPSNEGSFTSEVGRALKRHRPERIVVTEPGEWRVLDAVRTWSVLFGLPVDVRPDTRFIASRSEFDTWAAGRSTLRMEYFYREMRRKTGLLMDGSKPAGGQWNFDAENRKPATGRLLMPRPHHVAPDAVTQEVIDLVATRFADNFGDLEPFWFATTRAGAETARDHFLGTALADFGDYQDAMLTGERFLYHAVLSLYLNVGLLDALDLCRRAEAVWRAGKAPLNAVEGFIRQIIGWREYVRGIYWREMPGYTERNALAHHRPLPEFYWTGDTDMACLREAIGQTRSDAYAHHIQRLMVTGNFALLAGVDPHDVHTWYLAVYADAFEWVEAPNTIGMSQFADGGLLGSKPYAASGNYINRMSDYCEGCRFDVKRRTGAGACPLNALYWHFVDRHADRLGGNPRMSQVYATWRRMSEEDRQLIRAEAGSFLAGLDAAQAAQRRRDRVPFDTNPSPTGDRGGTVQSSSARRPRRAPTPSAK